MKSRGRIIKYLILLSILVISLLLCGCRSRLTDLDTATTTVVDEDGMMSEEYELRRYELGLYETKEPLFSGFDAGDDDEEYSDEDYDDEWGDYESEDEDYEEYEDEDEDDDSDDSRTTSPVRRPTTTHTTPVRRPGTGTQTTTYVTIKFDPNGGTLSTQTIRKASGFTYGTLPAPEREGYTFEGWYTEKKDGKKVSSTDKITAKKDFTLYAHWKKIKEEKPEPVEETYTVTFEPNGGEIKSGDSSKLLHKGDKYGSFPSVMWVGYKAAGWFTAAEGGDQVTESDIFNGNKDITLFAHWEDDFYGKWDAELDSVEIDDKAVCCYIKKLTINEEDGTISFSTSDNDKLFKRSKTELESDVSDVDGLIEKKVSYVVYAVDDMDDADSELEKLQPLLDAWPEGNIIIVPKIAANGKGSDNEQLYYALDFCNKVYNVFTDEEIAQAASELEIDL